MSLVRVSAVRYINSYPFILGLKDSEVLSLMELEVCHPSECASRLISGRTDVGLVPVAALSLMDDFHVISNYCLGTNGEVKTVLVVSNTPIEECGKIYLDFRSKSSNTAVRIIARKFWNREYEWIQGTEDFDALAVKKNEAAVIIGDQCFRKADKFKYRKDVGVEWKNYTGLPFVFACWASSHKLDSKFTTLFNKALENGVKKKNEAVSLLTPELNVSPEEVIDYYNHNIDFVLNEPKRKAMSLFLSYIKELNIQV
ncbi:MAG TPA: menaquinone biosynthesis protein [Bacteroidales bacterium]|nr:menaquinone biosynthesis protein [Bacteroidales bacterium]